jgi:hypothetical protein
VKPARARLFVVRRDEPAVRGEKKPCNVGGSVRNSCSYAVCKLHTSDALCGARAVTVLTRDGDARECRCPNGLLVTAGAGKRGSCLQNRR